ncbi:hypothetical protein [Mesorhizobium sp. M9A.F.Ca.ET.002.03.1.2]|nr:hypothetical protein [Mesorhizobium sp. M9A.F.Ca.ET.002.03.1.2]
MGQGTLVAATCLSTLLCSHSTCYESGSNDDLSCIYGEGRVIKGNLSMKF